MHPGGELLQRLNRRWLAALGPPVLFVALAWPGLRENSATFDETLFLPAGYTILTRGDLRLGPANPWLLKALFALPVLPLRPTISPEAERAFATAQHNMDAEWIFGDRFLYRDNRPQELLFRARLVTVVLSCLLIGLVFAWAGECFGPTGGLFAATLLALDPNVLAHGALATTDVGATLFFVATLYFARRALAALTVRDAVATALSVAAALAAKFSSVLLVPVLGAFVLLRLASARPWPIAGGRVVGTARGRARVLAGLLLVWSLPAIGSLWAVYGAGPSPGFPVPFPEQLRMIREGRVYGEMRDRGTPLPDDAAFRQLVDRTPPTMSERLLAACARYHVLPPAYVSGLAYQAMKAESRLTYLLGQFSEMGSPAYFPVAFAVKTPLATLVVFAVVLGLLCDRRSRLRQDDAAWWLLAPAIIVAGAAVGSRLNIGHRHILPLYPFLYVLAGALPGELRRLLGRGAAPVAFALVLGVAAETLAARPHFVSFFNVAAGGGRGGLDILADSNLDWGQGLPALRRWMDERGVPEVNLAYFGSADPAAYGIRFVPLPGSLELEVEDAGTFGRRPQMPVLPGWIAIGATHLQGVYLDPALREAYAYLRRKVPAAVLAGGAMYVYRVERWGE